MNFLNAVANFSLSFSMTLFFMMLFGNENSLVYKWKVLPRIFLKLSLTSIIAFTAWNTINNLSNPVVTPLGEILLNISLATLFAWAFYFHRYILHGNK